MADPVYVPVLRVMQVRKSAVDQRAHEVEGDRGALVAAEEQLRIGPPIGGGEGVAVDQIAAPMGTI